MKAEEYAGNPGMKVYSKELNVDDIAWISEDEGEVTFLPEESDVRFDMGKTGETDYKLSKKVDENGNLIIEEVNSIDEITDEDFENPTRNIGLRPLTENVSNAIGANGRRPIIKKNILEKKRKGHKDLTPLQSR